MAKTIVAKRGRIPQKIALRILYDSANKCCVCRNAGEQIQLHHIDKNPLNNALANTAALCVRCHGLAHATFDLSQNLTPKRITDAKREWESEVHKVSARQMLPRSVWQETPIWSYVNLERLPQIAKFTGVTYDSEVKALVSAGIINQHGIPLPVIEPDRKPHELITVFHRIPFQYRFRLMHLYTGVVNRFITKASPVDLGKIETNEQARALVSAGTSCYAFRDFYFKRETTRRDGTQIRLAVAFAKAFTIRFQFATEFVYGDSALSDSFSGHRTAACLLLVKDTRAEREKCIFTCTPLAIGTGFFRQRKASPKLFGPPAFPKTQAEFT